MNNMAGIYLKQGQHQKAIDLLENALTISPDYTRGRYDLAKILIVNGKWNAAESISNIFFLKMMLMKNT